MKKIWVNIVQIIMTFMIMISSTFSYINVESKTIDKNLIPQENIAVETKIEEPVEEEVPEEIVEEIQEEIAEPIIEEVEVQEPIYQEAIIVGNKIEIPGVLSKPLMKDEEGNHFYLNHSIEGIYDGKGVPYIDFRNDLTGKKTIIYAHSSTAGNGPFQALQNYHNNKSFYDNNRYIKIEYNGVLYTYEIFSVYVSVADSEESEGLEYFHRMNYTEEEWEETLQKYRNNSEYDTGVSVNKSDKILILQTCSMDPNYYAKYYRYNQLIMAKWIS